LPFPRVQPVIACTPSAKHRRPPGELQEGQQLVLHGALDAETVHRRRPGSQAEGHLRALVAVKLHPRLQELLRIDHHAFGLGSLRRRRPAPAREDEASWRAARRRSSTARRIRVGPLACGFETSPDPPAGRRRETMGQGSAALRGSATRSRKEAGQPGPDTRRIPI
jgi:hypothetical protein